MVKDIVLTGGGFGGLSTAFSDAEGVLQGLMSWTQALPLSILVAKPLARQLGQTRIEVDLDYAFSR